MDRKNYFFYFPKQIVNLAFEPESQIPSENVFSNCSFKYQQDFFIKY